MRVDFSAVAAGYQPRSCGCRRWPTRACVDQRAAGRVQSPCLTRVVRPAARRHDRCSAVRGARPAAREHRVGRLADDRREETGVVRKPADRRRAEVAAAAHLERLREAGPEIVASTAPWPRRGWEARAASTAAATVRRIMGTPFGMCRQYTGSAFGVPGVESQPSVGARLQLPRTSNFSTDSTEPPTRLPPRGGRFGLHARSSRALRRCPRASRSAFVRPHHAESTRTNPPVFQRRSICAAPSPKGLDRLVDPFGIDSYPCDTCQHDRNPTGSSGV